MTARSIVVAGGSSGIGLAVARQALAEGWRTIVVDRQDPLEDLESLGARFVRCDLLDVGTARTALEGIAQDEAGLDALVVSAGGAMNGHFALRDAEVLVEEFSTDTHTVLRAVRYLLPALQEGAQAHGVSDVVVIGSIAGSTAFEEAVVYGAAAAARHALGEQLRVELRGDRVRARTIATGYVETPLTARRSIPAVTDHIALAPLTAQDVAAVVHHCLNTPQDVNVHDMVLVPTYQGWA
ncbi:MAG: SDR family NAD(P)-dependent oxidoreductase [Actinomyces sp.]|uniref:SDR family oxidoreductase n=1 Tax=Actinomyces sp. TaxID=29317 RepID=UPI0026DC46E5|nr:SDR family NAD(P)-dependent oxidoreductase [Actinomyces sp.]MDO4243626.1 SDR family NAD(P)-dependent oxidoreductase [Actinomyces sp.]